IDAARELLDLLSDLGDRRTRLRPRLDPEIGQLAIERRDLPLRVLLRPDDLGQSRAPGSRTRGIGAERPLDSAEASNVGEAEALRDGIDARLARERRALDRREQVDVRIEDAYESPGCPHRRGLAIGRARRQQGARVVKFVQGPSTIALDGVGPGQGPVDLGGLAMDLADQSLTSLEGHLELLQGPIDAASFQQELGIPNIASEELVQ